MLIGNVGKDPDVRYLESNPSNPGNNAKVASFPLATSERYRDRNGELRENTEWHNIVVWRGNADVVEKFVRKGSQIYVEGRLRTRQWTDQTGNKRYTTEVVVDTLQLLGKRPDAPADAPGAYGQQPAYQGGYAAQPAAPQAAYQQPAPAYQGAYPQQSSQPAAPAASAAPGAPGAGFGPASSAPAGGFSPAPSAPGFGPAPAGSSAPSPSAYQGPLPAAEPSDDLPF